MTHSVSAWFGAGNRPEVPTQWLSDSASIYRALHTLCSAKRLNLEPITTPTESPQSNGMSEAFVNTLKWDYMSGADRVGPRSSWSRARLDRRLQCRLTAFGARLPRLAAVPCGSSRLVPVGA